MPWMTILLVACGIIALFASTFLLNAVGASVQAIAGITGVAAAGYCRAISDLHQARVPRKKHDAQRRTVQMVVAEWWQWFADHTQWMTTWTPKRIRHLVAVSADGNKGKGDINHVS